MTSRNWYRIFQIYVPFTVLFTVYFHTVISKFRASIYAVFVIDRTQKQMLLIILLKIYHRSVSQMYKLWLKMKSNMPSVTWYTLNYKIVAFFVFFFFFFFFEVNFEAPIMCTNLLKNICNGFHFFVCSFTQNMLLCKYFSRFLLRFVQ